MLPAFSQAPSDPSFYANPYPAYAAMRAMGPLVRWRDYDLVVSAHHEVVSAGLRDRRFGREVLHVASRAELGWPDVPPHLKPFYDFESHSLLEREPPVHTRLRGLVNRAFVSRAIERLREPIAALSHALIDGFSGQVDLIDAFCTPIPVCIICDLLGLPRENRAQYLDWSHAMVAMYQFGRTREVEDRAVAATLAFADHIRAIITERRRKPGDDLLSALINAHDDNGSLSEDEMLTTAVLLLNAGHEATVHAMANGVHALLTTGTDPRDAFADAQATELTVEEMLRFEAPLHLFTRYALENFEFYGHHFRKGEQIGLLLGAANHDPQRYEQADQFIHNRPIRQNVGFGGGIHFCIGAPLARMEMQVALPILFARCPELRLAETPAWRNAYHFHGLQTLPVLTGRDIM